MNPDQLRALATLIEACNRLANEDIMVGDIELRDQNGALVTTVAVDPDNGSYLTEAPSD